MLRIRIWFESGSNRIESNQSTIRTSLIRSEPYKYLDHCLPFAFGVCNEEHNLRYKGCLEFYDFFEKIVSLLPENELENIENHRQVYLNTQLRSSLLELDENGAVIIVDYKMRILPKTAQETKTEFYGKHGWTLHSVLMYTKLKTLAINNWTGNYHCHK